MKLVSIVSLHGHPVSLRIKRRSKALGVRNLFFLRGVARDVRRAVVKAFDHLDALGVVRDVQVYIVPGVTVAGQGFGVSARRIDRRGVAIAVAGLCPRGMHRTEFLQCVQHTLAHEWAHVEQFQTRGMWQERGIEVRARNLLKGCP